MENMEDMKEAIDFVSTEQMKNYLAKNLVSSEKKNQHQPVDVPLQKNVVEESICQNEFIQLNNSNRFIINNNWISLFIQRVDKRETVETMSFKLTHKYPLGCVKRVDFIYNSKNPNEKSNNYYQKFNSCFVHFNYWYDTVFTNNFLDFLENEGKIQIDKSEKFIIHINNKPIDDTSLNIHQLAANLMIMEKNFHILSSKLIEQNEFITNFTLIMEKKVNDKNSIIEKLLTNVSILMNKDKEKDDSLLKIEKLLTDVSYLMNNDKSDGK
jgi:hypothetical protein